jgi:hypothetical protein
MNRRHKPPANQSARPHTGNDARSRRSAPPLVQVAIPQWSHSARIRAPSAGQHHPGHPERRRIRRASATAQAVTFRHDKAVPLEFLESMPAAGGVTMNISLIAGHRCRNSVWPTDSMSDIHRKRRSAFKSDSRNTTLRNQTCRAVAHARLHADPADGLFYMALGHNELPSAIGSAQESGAISCARGKGVTLCARAITRWARNCLNCNKVLRCDIYQSTQVSRFLR